MTDSFIDYWDSVIRDWAETGEITASESFWFDEQRHLMLNSRLMPEPYWGDIDDNSVVLVNFNPAGSVSEDITDTCHLVNKHDRSTVCGLMSSKYSDIACGFPLLDEFPIQYAGASWWQKRVRWVRRFVPDSHRNPFAMELCAWHSKKWAGGKYGLKYPAIRNYISDCFGPWLRRALRGSEMKLTLCVGTEFADRILRFVWPDIEDITLRILDKPQPVPGNARRYRIFRIPGEGNIICTSARGSNRIPSESVFGEIEKEIFRKIKKNP